MGDRSVPFMLQLLTQPPLNLSLSEAKALAPSLRYFWATIANGDPVFDFPDFPPPIRQYFERFSTHKHTSDNAGLADNNTTLLL